MGTSEYLSAIIIVLLTVGILIMAVLLLAVVDALRTWNQNATLQLQQDADHHAQWMRHAHSVGTTLVGLLPRAEPPKQPRERLPLGFPNYRASQDATLVSPTPSPEAARSPEVTNMSPSPEATMVSPGQHRRR